MKTFHAPVDAPLRIADQSFDAPVVIIGQPTYGRVLFTSHDVFVTRCSFVGTEDIAALEVRAVHGAFITFCFARCASAGMLFT